MAKTVFLCLCLSVALIPRIAESQDSSLPTPPNIKIERPTPDLAQDLAAFSGTWEGWWGAPLFRSSTSLLSRLMVERINAASARVVYVWGSDPGGTFKSGFRRYDVKIIPGNKIEFISGEMTFTFEMTKDRNQIYAEVRVGRGSRQRMTMTRIETPSVTNSASSTTAPELPMPANLQIVPPSSELDPNLAAYSGIWDGRWDGGLFARLIVESIEVSSAQVLYVYDSSPGNFKAGWSRVKARVLNEGKLQ